MLVIKGIEDKKTWDSFVTTLTDFTFLHSWEWGNFNEALGDKFWRIGVYEDNNLIAVTLLLLVRARRGVFLFLPHGPLICKGNYEQAVFKLLVEEFREIAEKEKASFIRISPLAKDTEDNRKMFADLGFRFAPTHMHAEIMWTLSLESDEKELLANMRKTTRNLINRSNREGVKITISADREDLAHFYKLYTATAQKHRFTPFSLNYIEKQVEEFSKEDKIYIVLGWYNGKPQAGAIIVLYGKYAFYHHGASEGTYPKIPTAYAVQWAAIKEAKKRGIKLYNFWGIAPDENDKSHPWAGLTLFKKGFGGYRTDYLHARDLPLSWKYWISWSIEIIRRKRRNL